MKIHPTAIISSKAEIDSSVEIGAYSIIGNNVKIGENCILQSHIKIEGPCDIGDRNLFYPFSCIGEKTQDLKYHKEPTFLKIGNDNTFREHTTVHRATSAGDFTKIGNHNLFLIGSHIAHDCQIENHTIFSNSVGMAGHVIVGNHCIISGLAGIHQFCQLGEYSFIGGMAKINNDVPPYMIAEGNPAKIRGINLVGLKRNGISEEEIKIIKKIYLTLKNTTGCLKENLKTLEAEEKIKQSPAFQKIANFIKMSKRGILPMK